MAVFMTNICKFGCGKNFRKLGDLIQHIEEKHIDYDPRVVEQKELQQPACLPLSYVLRCYTEAARKEARSKAAASPPPPTQRIQQQIIIPGSGGGVLLHGPASATVSRSPTGTESEAEEEEMIQSETEDSNDSWTTPEEFSSEFILRQGSKNASNNVGDDKPFTCPVPGCKKKYKNVNGIKYHAKNGHKKDSGNRVHKAYRCPCGKSYRSPSGLKNHTQTAHSSGGGEGLKTLPIRAVTVLDPGFTLVTKGRQGNVLQLGILTPTLQGATVTANTAPQGAGTAGSTQIAIAPIVQHKAAVPGL